MPFRSSLRYTTHMGLLAPGAVIAGYRIESVIGRGGMGVVYRACELELDRDVALKVIAPELLEDEDIRSRFLREVRAAASVEHPNVVPVHAAGERNGVAFLAMRLIAGEDLKRLVIREGPLPPGRAVELVRRAAAGLDAIHRAGYVHRDVKPANVLVDRDGHVYVSDFGLARQVLDSVGPTGPGRWVGTLDYVAPEQIRGERVDARADVYALGGVLAFVLTGRVPYEREGDEAKLWAQLSELAADPVAAARRASRRRSMPSWRARWPRRPRIATPRRATSPAPRGRRPPGRPLPTGGERAVARGERAGDFEEASTVTAAVHRSGRRRRSRRPLALLAAALVAAAAAVIAVVAIDGDTPRTRVRGDAGRHAGHPQRRAPPERRSCSPPATPGSRAATRSASTGSTRRRCTNARDHPRVGAGASSIVSQGDTVWVAANRSRTVTQLDARTGRVVRTLRPGGAPWRLALGSGSLWVGTTADKPGANTLIRYDLNGDVISRRAVPHGIAALAATADAIWVAERNPPTVVRFDPADAAGRSLGEARRARRLPGHGRRLPVGEHGHGRPDDADRPAPLRRRDDELGRRPSRSRASRPANRVYVASNTDHTLLAFDPRTGRQTGKPISMENNPYALAADSRYVWVTGSRRGHAHAARLPLISRRAGAGGHGPPAPPASGSAAGPRGRSARTAP